MLKWLRKYNTWILVVGGVLLMVAFLIPDTIQRIGKQRMSGPVMRINGDKVSIEDYTLAVREHKALEELIGRDTVGRIGGGESDDHWVMLTRQAEEAGLVGGIEDGKENLRKIIEDLIVAMRVDESLHQRLRDQIAGNVFRAAAASGLTQDQVYQALSKLAGVMRLRDAYLGAPRYSDRRLIAGVKRIADTAEFKYVFIPPERLITDSTPKPDEAQVQAHYDKFKNTAPGESESGIGYRLPARVKLTWIALSKEAAAAAVKPDDLEIAKRMLKMYGNNTPTGADGDVARSRIEDEIKAELRDKVLKTLDQAVRNEIDKATRKLEADGDFKRLPAGWIAPDMSAIAHAAANQTAEITGFRVAEPHVLSRSDWQTFHEISSLEGISNASLKRGPRTEPLEAVALGVRELTGKDGNIKIQVGVPFSEPLVDAGGNRYYLLITDARNPSPPDTLAEVRDRVVADIQRLTAFEQLKAQAADVRKDAVANGLDSLAKSPDGVTGPAANPLNVASAKGDGTRIAPQVPTIDIPEFRKALQEAAAKLDPTIDLAAADPESRTVVVPSQRGLGLIVARIDKLDPITLERYRSLQRGMVARLQRDELSIQDGLADPFSQDSMEKRLKVEYLDGREHKKNKDKNSAEANAS